MVKRVVVMMLAALLSGLLSAGCLTLIRGTHQTVPAVSRPAGVRVFVDGESAGTTPVNLELTRRNIHTIRFELDGYRPVQITLKKHLYPLGAAFLVNAIWAPVGAVVIGLPLHAIFPPHDTDTLAGVEFPLLGALAAWIGGTFVDMGRRSNRQLEPHTLSITMEKDDGASAPWTIEMDAGQLEGLRWISVAAQ